MQKTVGLLIFLAGTIGILGIVVSEILYPQAYSYSVSLNMVSDLAFTRSVPRIVPEPSAAIFNLSLIVSGVLVLAADYIGRKNFSNKYFRLSFALLGIGAVGVGVFPEYHPLIHPWVALTAFLGGSLAAIIYSRTTSFPFSFLSLVLGAISMLFLVLGVFLPEDIVPVLGRGGAERIVVYPILIWLIAFGGYLMGSKISAKN